MHVDGKALSADMRQQSRYAWSTRARSQSHSEPSRSRTVTIDEKALETAIQCGEDVVLLEWFDSFSNPREARRAVVEVAVRSAITAYVSALGDGWQPIETAPKDGTAILLSWFDAIDDYVEPDAAVAGHWTHWADRSGWYLRGFGVLNEGGGYFSGIGESSDDGWPKLHPTHWRPLPEPPAMLAAAGGEE
jgi:hypothetical protein